MRLPLLGFAERCASFIDAKLSRALTAMRLHPYDPRCPHCIPILRDAKTREPYPKDSAEMVAILKVWNASSFAERAAFIAVTADHSREIEHLSRVRPLMDRVQAALDAVPVQ